MKAPAVLLLAASLALPPAFAQDKAPTEAQCKQMVDGLIQAMKNATLKESDKKGAAEVIAKAEKVAKDNRARGAAECESWKAIGNIVTGQ